MNVKELILALQQLPQDSMVVVRGHEDGVDEVECVYEALANLNVNSASYYGAHDIDDNGTTRVVRLTC